jgi:hypothetical protein
MKLRGVDFSIWQQELWRPRCSRRDRLTIPAQNALPRVGTLMMRLSIWNTPATACVIFSARLRRLPLQVVPASVTLPWATETDKPNGAIATLMCSTSAELIFASRSLLDSADCDVKVSRNRPSASLQTAFTQASTDSRSVLSMMW